MESAITVSYVSLSRQGKEILHDISFSITKGKVVSIIGPNGCGKSTLLKGITRMLPVDTGTITIHGRDLASFSRRELAQEMAVLTQFHATPSDVTVRELVRLGRFPYQRFYTKWTDKDTYYVQRAMESTQLIAYADTPIQQLSGGEQQRVWLAVLLAQRSPIVLLDEPTTYLDIRHQLYMMKLLRHCNEKLGLTIVIVLHDMNQALRYTDEVLVMKDGRLITQGKPQDVITPSLVAEVFGVQAELTQTTDGTPSLVTLDMC